VQYLIPEVPPEMSDGTDRKANAHIESNSPLVEQLSFEDISNG